MEEERERMRDAIVNAQRHGRTESNRELVVNTLRCVGASLRNRNSIYDNLRNSTQVSSVIVNHGLRGSSFYESVYRGPRILQNLTENVNLRDLDDPWQIYDPSQIQNLQRRRISLSHENVNDDYLTRFRLAEDMIVIRYLLDFRQPHNIVQYSTQIIWNSRFSWHQMIQHLQEGTYNFSFKREIMTISLNSSREEALSSWPAQLVDGLPDLIIPLDDADEMMCAICHDKFKKEEPAKQLECNHFYHSHCIFLWFSRNISCPTCRHKPTFSPQR